jgi:hypothetical protein
LHFFYRPGSLARLFAASPNLFIAALHNPPFFTATLFPGRFAASLPTPPPSAASPPLVRRLSPLFPTYGLFPSPFTAVFHNPIPDAFHSLFSLFVAFPQPFAPSFTAFSAFHSLSRLIRHTQPRSHRLSPLFQPYGLTETVPF